MITATRHHGQPRTPQPRVRRSRAWMAGGVTALLAVLPACAAQDDGGVAPPDETDITPTQPSAPPAGTATSAPEGEPPSFDEATLPSLFVTTSAVTATIPAAASGVEEYLGPGELPWELPEGSSVDPGSCTIARTVVAQEPTAFDARGWSADALDLVQSVALLPDPSAAEAAFEDLTAAVEQCRDYAQVNPGMDGGSWSAAPPTGVQEPFRGLWQERDHSAEGTTSLGYHGHLLVGNAIVTWSATAFSAEGEPSRDSLGTGEGLDAMVQAQAETAVAGLP